MTAFVGYFWSFIQWNIWIAFEDRKFLCQAEVTFTRTTFVLRRACLYVYPILLKKWRFDLWGPKHIGRVLCCSCALPCWSSVCGSRNAAWKAVQSNRCTLLLHHHWSWLWLCRWQLLADTVHWGDSCSCLYSCISLMRYHCLTSRWTCCGLRLLISCLLNSCN